MQGMNYLQIIILYVSNPLSNFATNKDIWAFMGLKYSEKQYYMLQPIEIINGDMVILTEKGRDLKSISSLNRWLKG